MLIMIPTTLGKHGLWKILRWIVIALIVFLFLIYLLSQFVNIGYFANSLFASITNKLSSGTSSVNSQSGPFLDIKNFGCVGDGLTNDTSCAQKWVNAVVSSGTPGWVSPGRYRITAPIFVSLSDDGSFAIFGPNRSPGGKNLGASFILDSNLTNNNTALLNINGNLQSSHVSIIGVGFAGKNKTGSGIKIKEVSERVTIERVRITGFSGRGLLTEQVIGVNIIGSHFEQNGIGWELVSTMGQMGEGTVVGSKFVNNTVRNVYLNKNSSFITFIGCTIYGSSGVELAHQVFSIGFYQCNFESGSPGIYVASGNEVSGIIIEGNAFNPSAASGKTAYGIDIAGAINNSRIQNNSVNGQPVPGGTVVGIRIEKMANTTVGPNRFDNGGLGTMINYSGRNSGIFVRDHKGGSQMVLYQDQNSGSTVLRGGNGDYLASGAILNLNNWVAGLAIIRFGEFVCIVAANNGSTALLFDANKRCSASLNNSGTINIYYDPYDLRYEIQNKTASPKTISVAFIGAD